MISRRPFLLLRISFPGRPIFIQLVPGEVPLDLEECVEGALAELLVNAVTLRRVEEAFPPRHPVHLKLKEEEISYYIGFLS